MKMLEFTRLRACGGGGNAVDEDKLSVVPTTIVAVEENYEGSILMCGPTMYCLKDSYKDVTEKVNAAIELLGRA